MKVSFMLFAKATVGTTWSMPVSAVLNQSFDNPISTSPSFMFYPNRISPTPSPEKFIPPAHSTSLLSPSSLLKLITGSPMSQNKLNMYEELMTSIDIIAATAQFWNNAISQQNITRSAIVTSLHLTTSCPPRAPKSSS